MPRYTTRTAAVRRHGAPYAQGLMYGLDLRHRGGLSGVRASKLGIRSHHQLTTRIRDRENPGNPA